MDVEQIGIIGKFVLAVLIGLLVGLEREHSSLEKKALHFAGIRTFPLIALLGCAAALLSEQWAGFFLAGFVGLLLLLAIVYAISASRGEAGLTTEVAVLLTYLLGGLVYWGYFWGATALGVLTMVLLALRSTLRNLVAHIEREDILAASKFAIVSVVVLPLLPNETFGPLDVLNPFQLWLMVVFVSGVSFSGYVAIKLWGHQQGIWITSLLGGLVSTTAVTLSFSQRSKEMQAMSRHLGLGVVIASTTMYFRVMLEVLAFNPNLARVVWLAFAVLAALGLGGGFFFWRSLRSQSLEAGNFSNPFRLWPAIQIAVLFGLILLLTKAASQMFGDAGILVASFLSGLTKIDPITLSLAQLAGRDISYATASQSLLLATTANILAKMVLASLFGAPALRRQTALVLAPLALANLGLAFLV